MSSCSIWSLRVMIWLLSCDASFVVTEHEITGRDTPHARPRATFFFVFFYKTRRSIVRRRRGRKYERNTDL